MPISFYTTCFGRLHHLRETLPRNLHAFGVGCEMVVVNWGADYRVSDLIKECRKIDNNIGEVLAVPDTDQPWDLNTARNLGWKFCRHPIRVSLDADNWIADPAAVTWCLAEFDRQGPTHYLQGSGVRGHHGRIAAHVDALTEAQGWPEGVDGRSIDAVEGLLDKWRERHYTSRRWPPGYFGVIEHEV